MLLTPQDFVSKWILPTWLDLAHKRLDEDLFAFGEREGATKELQIRAITIQVGWVSEDVEIAKQRE